jgi:hypothetical protein
MEVNIMNTSEFHTDQRHSQQEESLLLQPDQLELRRAYFYATPCTAKAKATSTSPAAILREKTQATLFVRQGVIFADKTVIPVFVAQEVRDEQYH